jgi:hypothetical protein
MGNDLSNGTDALCVNGSAASIAPGVDESQVLEHLAKLLRARWQGSRGQLRSLDFVYLLSCHLKEAHDICVPRESGVMPPKTWYKWLEDVGMNRKVAYEYLLIHANWECVKHLAGRQRSQRVALRIIRKSTRQSTRRRPTRRVSVRYGELLAFAQTAGFAAEQMPGREDLEKVVNRVVDRLGKDQPVAAEAC